MCFLVRVGVILGQAPRNSQASYHIGVMGAFIPGVGRASRAAPTLSSTSADHRALRGEMEAGTGIEPIYEDLQSSA
jgi:hypothetical protein